MAAAAVVLAHRAAEEELEEQKARAQSGLAREDTRPCIESVDPRVHDFKDSPSEELARELGYEWPQLNRKTFADRMELEAVMVDNTIQFVLYLVLVVLYLVSVCSVDPIGSSSAIGQELRHHFDVEKFNDGLEDKRTIDDVMNYTQTFFEKAFQLSPAMVDVHTRNTLDVGRCFDSQASDICSATEFWKAEMDHQTLMYWSFEALGPNQTSDILTPACKLDMCGSVPCGYKGPQAFPLSFRWGNVTSKKMDYRQQSMRGSTCMYKESHRMFWDFLRWPYNGTWLTPEKPLVLQRKKPYTRPYMVVTTPIVMQQRGTLKPCRGLGAQYVDDLAGYCEDSDNCDPRKVTPIDNAYSHPFSKRSYTAWVSYSEPVVECVDYEEEDTDFKDKSFNVWNDYDEFHNGKSQKGTILGEDVFYRFASDVRHLQAPFEPILVCPTILQGLNATESPENEGATMFAGDEYGIERPAITDPAVCGKCVNDQTCSNYFFQRYAAEMMRWSPLATGLQMVNLAWKVAPFQMEEIYEKFMKQGQQDYTVMCHAFALILDGNEDTLQFDFNQIMSNCGDYYARIGWNMTHLTQSVQEQEAPAVPCTDMIWLDPDMGCPGHDFRNCRTYGGTDPRCCGPPELIECAGGYVVQRDNSRNSRCGHDPDWKPYCCVPPGQLVDIKTFPCESGNICIPKWNRCNGIDNCDDGSDEQGCNASSGQASASGGNSNTLQGQTQTVQTPTSLAAFGPQLTTSAAPGNASSTVRRLINVGVQPGGVQPELPDFWPDWLAQMFSPAIWLMDTRKLTWWGQAGNPTVEMMVKVRQQVIQYVAGALATNREAKASVEEYIRTQVQSLDPMKDKEHELWCVDSEDCLMHQKCLSDASSEQKEYDDRLGKFVHDADRRSRLMANKIEQEKIKCEAKMYYILENLMLSDTSFKRYRSVRRLWEKSFMDLQPDKRKNTFLTRATSKYMLALLVVTPQAEGRPEIITTVQVSFEFGQYGGIDADFSLVSATGQLMDGWVSLMIWTIVVAALYMLVNIGLSLYRGHERRATGESKHGFKKREMIDTWLPICMAVQLIVLWRVRDKDYSVQLADAFKTQGVAGREEKLFQFYADLVDNNFMANVVKMWGIFTAYALFVRLVAYMAVHPRIALLVTTMSQIADDLFHFAISFLLIFLMMGVMAYWMFGTKVPDFDSPNKALYMQFRMVAGDFDFLANEDDPGPLFMIYAITFVVLVFMILLNFFLAIVVDGFVTVKNFVKEDESDNNFGIDLVLVTMRLINTWRGVYPNARALRQYMQDKLEEKLSISIKSEIQLQVLGESRAANAVTADELYESVRGQDRQRLFRSPDHARTFLLGYAAMFPRFIENDLDLCWKQGQYMDSIEEMASVQVASSQIPKRNSLLGAVASISMPKDSPDRKKALSNIAEENNGNQDGLPVIMQELNKLGTQELTQVIVAATRRIQQIQAVEDDLDWAVPDRVALPIHGTSPRTEPINL